ncbi:hypothetical protein F4678DRAFT_322290 [Xylaria arbuscula]|nr:hypothetical protein F4678DRAFT_322290 [Xylaria arbuscula]
MQFSTITSLFLAALATASAAPPSSSTRGISSSCFQDMVDATGGQVVTFVMTTPDCPALKAYCTHCNGDFNCESDPRCEWCYEHKQFGHNGEMSNN